MMSRERWEEVDSVLQKVLGAPADEREMLLVRECEGDESLADEVRSLLDSLKQSGEFLEDPALRAFGHLTLNGSSATDVLVGRTISHYRIDRKIAAGGMGVVYRAEDTRLRRFVALKFLSEEFDGDHDALMRFQREARATSALSHPNICAVYDLGEYEKRAYIVMEFIDGESLKDHLRRGRIGINKALDLVMRIGAGLQAAHEAGIVHRDIKPSNIMVSQNGVAKILDFGLAQLSAEMPVTSPGMALGTLGYMSPEQQLGQLLDIRTDVYSLGLVLHEMVTGTKSNGRVRKGSVPHWLARLLAKCLEPERSRRYQSVSELLSALRTMQGRSASPFKYLLAAAGAVVAAGVVYLFTRGSIEPQKLTAKDSIVLADFTDSTGEEQFDDLLRQGLATELEQSPSLNFVPENRIRSTLKLMGRPMDARLTPGLAYEVCERIGSAAVLQGSLVRIGEHYIIGLVTKACTNGKILDSEQVEAKRREDVLDALGRIARGFRTKIGESLASVQSHSTPLAEATTPSLEALQAYSTGLKLLYLTGDEAALPLLERAVEIDPRFAMAHARLSRVYGAVDDPARSAESATKAYHLMNRVSQPEKYYIGATFDMQVTGNFEKALVTCEAWQREYPHETNANAYLGLIYSSYGRYDKAMRQAAGLVEENPSFGFGYLFLSEAHRFLNDYPGAEAALQRAAELKLPVPNNIIARYDLAFLRADEAEMQRIVAQAKTTVGAEDRLYSHEASVAAYAGRIRYARNKTQQAVELALRGGHRDRAALYQVPLALSYAFVGDFRDSRDAARAALKLSDGLYVRYGAGLALAMAGDEANAQAMESELEKRFSEDTGANFSYIPCIRAQIALSRNEPAKAIELLSKASPYETGIPRSAIHGNFGSLYPAYLRGMAFLAMKRADEAALEFQKILAHPGLVVSDPVGALARLQLARAFALSGRVPESKAAYADFSALWKAADSDVPVVRQASKELATRWSERK